MVIPGEMPIGGHTAWAGFAAARLLIPFAIGELLSAGLDKQRLQKMVATTWQRSAFHKPHPRETPIFCGTGVQIQLRQDIVVHGRRRLFILCRNP